MTLRSSCEKPIGGVSELGALDGTVTVFRVTSIGQGDQAHDYFRHTALGEAVPVLWRRDTKLYT